jgi:hypothetical protein
MSATVAVVQPAIVTDTALPLELYDNIADALATAFDSGNIATGRTTAATGGLASRSHVGAGVRLPAARDLGPQRPASATTGAPSQCRRVPK